MRKIACALAFLASAGHGRRVQSAGEQHWQSRLHARSSMLAFNSPAPAAPRRTSHPARGQLPPVVTASVLAVETSQESPSQDWAGVAAGVEHGQLLPEVYTKRISAADEEILNFLLLFMESEGLDYADVYINGGYVRDLLRGREPDDLDLSVCLQGTPEEVTVAGLMENVPAFAKEHPELSILNVTVTGILANEGKNKMIDSFKSLFVNKREQRIEVDVMPTIGEEFYEQGSRVPFRDHRGSAEEDALRRDLTVGALLLKVERGSPGSGTSLSYRVFDFYGGLADLRAGVLRAPFPSDKTYQEVASAVLRTDQARELAEYFSLSSRPEPEAVQILWWAKLLMDDPVRVCRALRFQAKLQGFVLHESFWDAVPFALTALCSTVAGNRKYVEFVKLAGSGFQACTEFIEMAFTRTLVDSEHRLAPALFGGVPAVGAPVFLSEFTDFDQALFRDFASELEGYEDPEKLLGGVLACAVASAVGLEDSAEHNFWKACEGMCTSGETYRIGMYPLYFGDLWVQNWQPPNVLDNVFAKICGISPEAMQMHSRVWRDLRMPGAAQRTRQEIELPDLALRFARHFLNQSNSDFDKEPQLPDGLPEALSVVSVVRPQLRGSLISGNGVLEVPPKLRSQVLALLEITVRLIFYDKHIETSDDLETFLDRFPTIREALRPEALEKVEMEFFLKDKKTRRFSR
mmetsp:Transcript_43852/g.82258  ORF Transcript_43852/g.82258 Transcript_43852/m.82258 type:complete len:690 (+) Transcript_43852:80-2149(+)